jgi:hypothetical protein
MVFHKCRKFGISLNPKKSNFGMQEGKLFGHIISKEGIKIDRGKAEAILKIGTPRSKKEVQSFLGKVNFLRLFMPNLVEIIKYITNMLRKGNEIKWTHEARKSFEDIKATLSKASVLAKQNFAKDFILFSFASEHTIVGVLLQKDEWNFEKPIAYFSRTLRDSPLRYDIMKKQEYALLKALKEFRTYTLHSCVIVYVPSNSVKDILTQPNPEGRRRKWIAIMLEHDLEIKPTKLIKGQGLAKLMAQSNCNVLGINFIVDFSKNSQEEAVSLISQKFLDSPWYNNVIYVLRNLQAPPGLSKTKARFSKLREAKFYILDNSLYCKDPGGILLNCLLEEEMKKAIKEFHKGDCGGHHYGKTTAHKTLRAGFYWPSIFSDVYKEVSSCHECQILDGKRKLQTLPLKLIYVEASFMQWDLDFIGEIHPPSSAQHRWILTATDYVTKWIEAVPSRQAIDTVIIVFLESNILSLFGSPVKLIIDNATTFKSKKMEKFCSDHNITLGQSTAYYPQGDGLDESYNKSLTRII